MICFTFGMTLHATFAVHSKREIDCKIFLTFFLYFDPSGVIRCSPKPMHFSDLWFYFRVPNNRTVQFPLRKLCLFETYLRRCDVCLFEASR